MRSFFSILTALVVVTSCTQLVWAQEETDDGDQQVVEETVESPDGRTIRVRVTCAEGQPCHIEEVRLHSSVAPAGGSVEVIGDWSLGINPLFTGTFDSEGPDMLLVEGAFVGDLRIDDEGWFFHVMIGPGIGRIHDATAFVLSEFAGVQYRFSDDGHSVTFGARHRIAFLPESDEMNFLGGEVQARFRLAESLYLSFTGSLGNAWYPVEETQELYIPAGVDFEEPEPNLSVENGLGGSVGLGLEVRF